MSIGKKYISLNTYKYEPGPKRLSIGGDSKIVKIDKEWLKKQLHPRTIDEFLDEYTYDDAEYLFNLYQDSLTKNS